MSDSDLDAIRGSSARRALLALPVLALLGAGAWWLLRPTNLGEPEQAHRVLLISSAQFDLTRTVSPAGFEVDQDVWSEHQGQSLDELIDDADERGYGFLNLVFDEAAPWPASELDPGAPTGATAVAISVGDMREPGAEPVLRFGAPIEGIDMPPSLDVLVGLRVALYDHPDLVRLWDNPTPAQRTQQVQLGPLEDRRTELRARLERQREAAGSWPVDTIPADALSKQWVDFTGLAIAGGMLIERASYSLTVDNALIPRLEPVPEGDAMLQLATATFPNTASARIVDDLPTLAELSVSANRRYLAALADHGSDEVRRWQVADDGASLEELPSVDLRGHAWEIEISDAGAVLGRYDDELSTTEEIVYLSDDIIRGYDWVGEDLFLASITGEWEREGADQALVFFDGRPRDERADQADQTDEDAEDPLAAAPGLRALTIYAEDLNPAGTANGPRPSASVATWAVGGGAVFVLINVSDGNDLRHLVRLEVSPEVLRQSEREVFDRYARHDTALDITELRTGESGVGMRVLGQLPRTHAFLVSPDGSWVAWWDDNDEGTLQAAPVTKTGLGEVTTLATLGEGSWARSRRPSFAGPRSLLVPSSAAHALGEASYLRLIELGG